MIMQKNNIEKVVQLYRLCKKATIVILNNVVASEEDLETLFSKMLAKEVVVETYINSNVVMLTTKFD